MGIIEDAITQTYQKALKQGQIEQAKKAVELAKILREKVEMEGFVDIPNEDEIYIPVLKNVFEPHIYRYYPEQGIVVIFNSAISLTPSENKLFKLFSKNESRSDDIKIITKDMVKTHMWGQNEVSYNAVRICVHRLRNKIDHRKYNSQIILNLHNKGYIFLGKRVYDKEQKVDE